MCSISNLNVYFIELHYFLSYDMTNKAILASQYLILFLGYVTLLALIKIKDEEQKLFNTSACMRRG